MAKSKTVQTQAKLQLRAIELLHNAMSLPADQHMALQNFEFALQIENRIDAPSKMVFVIVQVAIFTGDQAKELGKITVSCIFEIANFSEVIILGPDGQQTIPQHLIEMLNSISISTTRGVMFATYKGTYLHTAVLPIIDPKQFQTSPAEPSK
jgi:hypothetical protein